jgi:RHS repeat-associated protein
VVEGEGFYQPLRWPGHYFDDELQLQYNRFRTYSPELGRYYEPDPLGRGGGIENVYAYTRNPLFRVDTHGLGCPFAPGSEEEAQKAQSDPGGKADEETTGELPQPKIAGESGSAAAGKISEEAALARAAQLRETLPRNKRPTMTSAAVDAKTGKIYYGDSGTHPDNINQALRERMPATSLEAWSVENCAEFNATNNALNNGAKMEDLTITTVRVKNGDPEPRCDNCRVTTDGAHVTSD